MYPHERSLVERLKAKPFALIGINTDTDKEKLKKRLTEEKITWRSFWDGPQGTGGPISRAWNIQGYPTVYVLDHKGVIRFKHLREEKLDEAVNKLLSTLEKSP